MTGSSLLGLASTTALLLPPALVLLLRLYRHLPFVALAAYCLLSAAHNMLALGWIPATAEVTRTLGTFNNYLDGPLMLLLLHFFCAGSSTPLQTVRAILLLLLAYEVMVGLTYRTSLTASTLVLGPAIGAVLLTSAFLFMRHIRLTIVQNKGLGKTLLLAGLVFGYGCFAILYFLHYIHQHNAQADIFLLYYAATTLTALLFTAGLLVLRRHFRELEELRRARRELRLFFHQ